MVVANGQELVLELAVEFARGEHARCHQQNIITVAPEELGKLDVHFFEELLRLVTSVVQVGDHSKVDDLVDRVELDGPGACNTSQPFALVEWGICWHFQGPPS